jgi:murein L,D-transpeptidase YcbB/YkuD
MTGQSWACGLLIAVALSGQPGGRERAAVRKLAVGVDLSRGELQVRIDGRITARYPVSVGKADYRTPVGSYRLSKVIWNPSWVPPDGKWAENAEPKGPREPGNPMGRVKIFFAPELYIHGTPATGTLGEPVSHGCIRLSNRDAMRLARLVMDYGGARKGPAWLARVQRDEKQTYEVNIPNPPLLEITQ